MADIQKLNVNGNTYDISTTWDKVTGKPNYYEFSTQRDFGSGTLIKTSINYDFTDGDPFYGEIKGNTYGDAPNSCFTQFQGYIYDNTIIAYGVTHLGDLHITPITAMNIDGKLCFWFPRLGYWMGFSIKVTTGYDYSINRVTSVIDSAEPSGTKKVVLTSSTVYNINSQNIASQSVNYATSAGSSSSVPWSGVTGKPATFTPSSHTHTFASLTSKPTTIAGYGITDAYTSTTIDSKLSGYLPFSGGKLNGTIQTPLVINTSSTAEVGVGYEMSDVSKAWVGYNPNSGVILYNYACRKVLGLKDDGTPHYEGKTLLHSGNYNSYAPTLTGAGASGTWGINISGNAATATNADNANTAASIGSGALKYMCSLHTTGAYNAYKIITNWHKSWNLMPTINIRGFNYGSNLTIDCDIVMYHFENIPVNYSLTNKGSYPIRVWQAIENDVQVFYINPGAYFGMFNVFIYSGIDTNRLSGWSMTTASEVSGTEISKKPIATNITGNAVSASKWATPRTLSLTGSVTGSVSIDGGGDVTLNTTTNHTHNYLPLSGGTLSTATSQISRGGSSTCWYLGRSNAMLKISSYSGYNAITSMKTTNGDWSMGVYSGDYMYFTYVTDSNFNAGNNSATAQIYFTPSGYVNASAFYQSSDERLKTFYDPIKVDLDKLSKLRKNYFKFNDKDKLEIGVSAQEIQSIYPEIVSTDDNGYLSVAYDKLSVIALAAIDELDNKYKKEINDLKDQLDAIKNILNEKGIL